MSRSYNDLNKRGERSKKPRHDYSRQLQKRDAAREERRQNRKDYFRNMESNAIFG